MIIIMYTVQMATEVAEEIFESMEASSKEVGTEAVFA